MPNNGTSLRSIIFWLLLSGGLTLAGFMGLLITRLRHPLVVDLLSPWQVPPPNPQPGLEDQPLEAWPLIENQFTIDLASIALILLGLFMVVHYRRLISPILSKLEDMSLDRW